MSINDPQWGNSHRPEQKNPDQVPESTGTESPQPKPVKQGDEAGESKKPTGAPQKPPTPPEGPPDLEVLWQQLVYKVRCGLARLLGREPPGPPVAPSAVGAARPAPTADTVTAEPMLTGWQALSLRSWLIGVSLLIGAWLISGFYLVDTQQRGVLSRMGQVVTVSDPGWHWRWPYPFERVRLVNVDGDRTLEVGLSEQKGRHQSVGLMTTRDGNLVNVAYAIVYRVKDPVAYLNRAAAPADILVLAVEDSLRGAIAQQTLGTLLSVGETQPALLRPSMGKVQQQLQAALDVLEMGVDVKAVELREVQLPPSVISTVKAVDREEQALLRAMRERQNAATESLVKIYQLADRLGAESAGYARALEATSRAFAAEADAPDAAAAAEQFAQLMSTLRQQYPLVFASLAGLQQMVGAKAMAGEVSRAKPAQNEASAATANEWRDREVMRSRDRVDRPGSGS